MICSARNLTRLQRRRLSWRVANGTPLHEAGDVAPAAMDDLLADGHFSLLVEAYRALAALPEDARRRRLLQLAIQVIEQATMTGDMRIALFVMKQETLGRDAAEALADGVMRALERREPERRPPDDTSTSTRPLPPNRAPSCPVDNAVSRAAASLRSEVLDEFEMQAAVAMSGPNKRLDAGEQAPTGNTPAQPAEAVQPRPSEFAPPERGQRISADRLTERQMQYLADLALERSRSTAPPSVSETEPPEAPDSG